MPNANNDNVKVCECCDENPVYRDGLCRDCEHPDDTDFWDYDPGEEY